MPLTPTLIQSVAPAAVGGSTTINASLTGVTAGNTLIIAGCLSTNGTATITFSDGTNTYTNCQATTNDGTTLSIRTGFASNIAGGNVTVTVTSTVSGTMRAMLQEWSNLVSVSPLDQTAHGGGTSGTAVSTNATGTLSQSGELVVCYAFTNVSETWTVGTGFTPDPTIDTGASSGRQAEYLIASGTTAQTGTFTMGGSTAWVTQLATFIPAASPSSNIQMFNRRYVLFNT